MDMTAPDTSRVWLITGTSSGFGRHLAAAALARVDRLVATARRPEALAELVASAPDRVHAVALDVTGAGQIEEVDMGELRALMETMFFGPFALTQAVLPHMRERRSGAIVQMSSMGGQISPPGFGAYCSAKFALEAASESLAAEVAPYGIRVLIVEPGSFRTEFGGARLHRSREIGAYTETAGRNRAFMDSADGTQ